MDWDLKDYDDIWHSWPTPQEDMTIECERMYGDKFEVWAEEDEERYLAALLAAGSEPVDDDSDAHRAWQQRAAKVLMQKYRNQWWAEGRVHADPKYRQKAETCRQEVQIDELYKFYAWVCKQRGELWAQKIEPR